MAYQLGIDLGTTYTAAAVHRDGVVEIVTLGDRAPSVPSVIFLTPDESLLTGDAANRRGLRDPSRVAREFKRRIGDPTPVLLGGSPHSAEALMAKLLAWTVERVTERQGGPPEHVTLSHPANWGPYKKDLLEQAIRMAGLADVTTVSEPEAAAVYYASNERVEPGSVIAVYDLGGGTFDAAVLRKDESGWEILGRPEGIERLGGIDFDAAVFAHVRNALAAEFDALDPDDPAARAAVARVRQDCVEAKEALSSDTEAVIPVLLPKVQTEVRLTRSEFEAMIRPTLQDTIGALHRALDSAGVGPDEVSAVLLVGGSSRIPLVSQLVGAEVGRPVAVDAHPKHAIALGASLAAATAAAEARAARAAQPAPEPVAAVQIQAGVEVAEPAAGAPPAPETVSEGPETVPEGEVVAAPAAPAPEPPAPAPEPPAPEPPAPAPEPPAPAPEPPAPAPEPPAPAPEPPAPAPLAPEGQGPPASIPPPAAPPAPDPGPGSKRGVPKWAWAAAAVGVLALVGGAIVAIGGGGDSGSGSGSGTGPGLAAVKRATVAIATQGSFVDPQFGSVEGIGEGSGFLLSDDGIVVTNNHVVVGAASIEVGLNGEDKPRNGIVVGASECSDLAVIQLSGGPTPFISWSEEEVDTGLEVFAFGYPLGEPSITQTKGIVSKAQADGQTFWASIDNAIEHDVRINPGSSGGPLVDAEGRVVGVNFGGNAETDQFFAISVEGARQLVERLRKGEDVNSIGVNGQAVVADDGSISGVWVSGISSGSPADEAGIEPGDVITRMEGVALAEDGTMSEYCDVLRSHDPTDALTIEVLRFSSGEVLTGQINGRPLSPA